MQAPNIPILLADAHTCSRIGLYKVLVDAGFEIVGEVESVEALWQELNEQTLPSLLLIAENLLLKKPLAFILELCQQQPDCQIVLLLNNCQDLPLPALLDAGVKGMVTKTEPVQTLVQTIQTAATDQRAMSPMVMDRMLQSDPQPEIVLNALEEHLLQLVCAEKTNLEIAETLSLSHKTVEKWLTALYTKLGVRSRTGAALWFERCYDLEGFPS